MTRTSSSISITTIITEPTSKVEHVDAAELLTPPQHNIHHHREGFHSILQYFRQKLKNSKNRTQSESYRLLSLRTLAK